jgi:VWFA-related protein
VASRPGRKLILCLSPGWPFLSGPGVELTSKGQQQLFGSIVDISTLMLQARITLYSIDPLGASEAGTNRVGYWENFAKGVSKPGQVQAGNLALQVLATQSGGLALNSSNDITGLVQKCIRDNAVYYELSFNPPPGGHPHEYHHLEIHIAKPGLTARTRQGYYSQP